MAGGNNGHRGRKSCVGLLGPEHSETSMRKIYPEDLTLRKIHYLILEKRRLVRSSRLVHFYRTGRVISFVGEINPLDDIRCGSPFEKPKSKNGTTSRHTLPDRILSVIELLAIIGLIFIVITGVSTLGTLNQNFAARFRQPIVERRR
jgi:hypothetical protein